VFSLRKLSKKSIRVLTYTLGASLLAIFTGCSAAQQSSAGVANKQLTQKDVLSIFQPGVVEKYQDKSMKQAYDSASLTDLKLTDQQVQKIKDMHLKIAMEWGEMADANKWESDGVRDAAKELGIQVSQEWVASDTSGLSQVDDYQRILPNAQNYDAIFTLPLDAAATSSVLNQIMQKTKVGFICTAPFNFDWNNPNFMGVSDADGYLAGKYSAEAAVKILGGKGTIAAIGWVNGQNGNFHTVQVRYQGWNDVLKKYPNIKVVKAWYDNPSQANQVISSTMASNPGINLLLVDWANPAADQAQQILKQRGLKAWKNISMVTIDTDNTITVPMAQNGPNNNYTAAYVTQTWYNVGKNMIYLYANNLLKGNQAPKFVASPPLPLTTWNNLKTNYSFAVPANWPIPKEIQNLNNQWPLGVPNEWK
jgi:ribose transport system substrate-binding protein